MPGVARVGDTSTHGGLVITGAAHTFTGGGQAVARIGDLHACPLSGHGTTAIITGHTQMIIQGAGVAVRGVSVTGCGAIITGAGGSFNVG